MATTANDGRDAASGHFDPVAGSFVAQSRRPPGLAPVDSAALTPLQRCLLVTDGTVTTVLEAWSLEPVEVRRLGQESLRLTAADEWLALPAGAPVIRRRVMLAGGHSQRFFAWADSLIAAERLTPGVRLGVERGEGGLGRILVDAAAETRRECLWYGRESRDGAPPEVAACWPGEFLSRCYRVFSAGRPLMLITERFPL